MEWPSMRSSFEVTSTSVDGVILFLRTTYATIFLYALVAQLAEATDSKPVQCEFESHQGHHNKPSQESFSARVSSCLGRDVGTNCSHGRANTGGQGGLFYGQKAWRVVFRWVVIIGRGSAEEPEHAGHINGVSQVAKIFRAHQRWGFNDFVLAQLRAQGCGDASTFLRVVFQLREGINFLDIRLRRTRGFSFSVDNASNRT